MINLGFVIICNLFVDSPFFEQCIFDPQTRVGLIFNNIIMTGAQARGPVGPSP